MKNALIVILSAGSLVVIQSAAAQDKNAVALANADTSNYSVKRTDGWELYNSYVATRQTDSVQLEVIVQHASPIDISQEQFIGQIKNQALQPKKEQTVPFILLYTTYQVRIDEKGKCYLKLASGVPPTDDPVVIPVDIVFYKK